METPLLSFVIVTMNRRDTLRRCLETVVAQHWPHKEIIVVDNGSSDGTADMVQHEFPDVQLLVMAENRGAAGGKNVALQSATGDYIVALDDDVTFCSTDSGERVARYFAADPALGVLSFNLVTAEGTTEPRTIPRRDKKMLYADTKLGYFLGGACAFRRAMLAQTGTYWEALNPYGAEEFDLSYRIHEAGYGILWTHGITAIHHESPLARPDGRKTYAMARNNPLVAGKNLPWPYVISHYMLWWGYALRVAARTGSFSAWGRGVVASLCGAKQALRERKVVSASTVALLRKTSGPLWY